MLFLDNEHHDNFFIIQAIIPKVKSDSEYRSTAYILAIPAIYNLYGADLESFMFPPFWMYEHLKTSSNKEVDASIFQLGLLSIHLWNGDTRFDLLQCIKKLDKKLFAVCMHAINIRKNSDLLIFM